MIIRHELRWRVFRIRGSNNEVRRRGDGKGPAITTAIELQISDLEKQRRFVAWPEA